MAIVEYWIATTGIILIVYQVQGKSCSFKSGDSRCWMMLNYGIFVLGSL